MENLAREVSDLGCDVYPVLGKATLSLKAKVHTLKTFFDRTLLIDVQVVWDMKSTFLKLQLIHKFK